MAVRILCLFLLIAFALCQSPLDRGPYEAGLRLDTLYRSSSTDESIRELQTWIWYPSDGESGIWADGIGAFMYAMPIPGAPERPLVLFSHGGCGHPLQSTYLYSHLTSWGFVVICTHHPGSVWGNPDCLDPDVLRDTWLNRPQDVEFTLDSIYTLSLAQPWRYGRIDTSRILMSGHSFGGRTSYAVANRYDFAKCVIAFSASYGDPFGADMECMDDIRGVDVPILIMGGTLDYAVARTELIEIFDTLIAPKYAVLLNRGGHLAYGDECNSELDPLCDLELLLPQEIGHEIILTYSMSFIYKYLLDDLRWEEYLYEDYDTLAEVFYEVETVVEDLPSAGRQKSLEVAPNPFNSAVDINIPSGFELAIYDVIGTQVASFPAAKQAGTVNWQPADDVISGVYIAKASDGDKALAKRIVYIK